MNRRASERIPMRLPCLLNFPEIWRFPVSGTTANMHHDGVLISCESRDVMEAIPAIGTVGEVKIELPANPAFSRKCIDCNAILLRASQTNSAEWQFALRIRDVAFRDWTGIAPRVIETKGPSSSLPV